VVQSRAAAERLPLKTYTTSDGLPHNTINKIVRDSRGFLWFCTEEGLSRFDGYSFTNYGTGQGLPHTSVNDILETRAGDYWVATNGGLVRFNPKGTAGSTVVAANEASLNAPPMFSVVVPEDPDRYTRAITVLLESRDGTVWCGSLKGLYRLQTGNERFSLIPIEVGIPSDYGEGQFVSDLAEDRYGSIWIATHNGLYRRWADGSTAQYTARDGLPNVFIHDLLIDHLGQLWIGTRYGGFFRLAFDETHAKPSVAFTLTPHDFAQSEWINQLFETSENKIWAATARGLLELMPEGDRDGRLYRVYTTSHGLSTYAITALAEDAGGNLWLGSGRGTGVMKLARHGFVSYDQQDGIASVFSIFGDHAGGICFRGYVLGDKRASIFEGGKVDLLNLNQATYWQRFGRFNGQQITWFTPDVLKGKPLGWVDEGVTLQARSGEWWFANALYHFPAADNLLKLKTARPLAYFEKDTPVGARQIWRLFEDSRARIWISIIDSAGNGLALWDADNQTLRDLTNALNLPSLQEDLARSFGEDRAGNVWLGFNAGLARFRDGVFTFFGAPDGLPPGAITDIYTDHNGRLWLASSRSGLIRIDDPTAERLTFTSYTTAQGLSGNVALAITEDLQGRLYIGTGQGLDQLAPASGRIKHYTTADGLVGGEIKAAFRDRDGYLWIGTTQGASRFLPEPDQPSSAPVVLLTGINIAGIRQQLSALGEIELHLPDLAASASQLQIDFVGLAFATGESLRYQYRLEGVDREWSRPTAQRTVTYARLASGRYRFVVRAVDVEGQVSERPAVITFRVLPPIWLRWWFIALALVAAGGAAYALYRYRVARLLEVANMRTRIATDLHDDIGANLTRISILSEVAKQQFGNGQEASGNPLNSIAEIARESVSSMSDIVWAIAPNRESLLDLTRRMRQHADEVFTLRDISLQFNAPASDQNLRLGVDVRRDFLLISKEAVNNAARHSHCSRVEIDFQASSSFLSLRVSDNGVGFDAANAAEGHGLKSMRQRAEKLSGVLTVETAKGTGTTVRVRIPTGHSRAL